MLLSGVMGAALDRMFSVKAATNEPYLRATVTSADSSAGRFRQTVDQALVARARQLVLIYAMFNARNAAAVPMRLYAPAKTKGVKSRGVEGKRKNTYLRDYRTGPGIKAARYADMAGDVVEITDHPILDLLNNANPWQRGTTFSQAHYMQFELFGRAYVHVVGKGEPEELWLMAAHNTKIIPDRSGLIGGFRYGRSGETEIDFNVDEVMYHRLFPSPFNPYDSLGPLSAITDEVDIYSAATIAEVAMWQNGARPDWVLSVPPNTPQAEIDATEAKIQRKMQGPRKRGQFLITSLVEPKALQFTPKEMEYLQGKQDIRKTIRAAYGIPESIDELNSANLASATMGHAQYARYTLQPRVNQAAEEWSETLLRKYGIEPGEMWFAADSAIPDDKETLRADAQAYIPLGVLSVNEVRTELGFDMLTDPKADEHRLDQPNPGGFGVFGTPPDSQGTAEPQGAAPDRSSGKAAPASACTCGKCGKKQRRRKDDRADRSIERQMQDAIEKWYRSLSNVQPDQSGHVNLLPYESELEKILRPYIVRMFAAGSASGLAAINSDASDPFSVYPDRAVAYLSSYCREQARGIVERLQKEINNSLIDSMSAGENLADSTGRMMESIGEDAPWRAERIVRTEGGKAMHEGSMEAWKASGLTHMEWLLSEDACPVCKAFAAMFNGKQQPIGTPFMQAGGQFMAGGSLTTLQQDVRTPEDLHPNCRCTLVPVVND